MYFKTEKVSDRITRICGIAGELMYLAEGDREAALDSHLERLDGGAANIVYAKEKVRLGGC